MMKSPNVSDSDCVPDAWTPWDDLTLLSAAGALLSAKAPIRKSAYYSRNDLDPLTPSPSLFHWSHGYQAGQRACCLPAPNHHLWSCTHPARRRGDAATFSPVGGHVWRENSSPPSASADSGCLWDKQDGWWMDSVLPGCWARMSTANQPAGRPASSRSHLIGCSTTYRLKCAQQEPHDEFHRVFAAYSLCGLHKQFATLGTKSHNKTLQLLPVYYCSTTQMYQYNNLHLQNPTKSKCRNKLNRDYFLVPNYNMATGKLVLIRIYRYCNAINVDLFKNVTKSENKCIHILYAELPVHVFVFIFSK